MGAYRPRHLPRPRRRPELERALGGWLIAAGALLLAGPVGAVLSTFVYHPPT